MALCVCLQRQVSLGGLETLYFVHVGADFTQAMLLCFLWSQEREKAMLFGLEAGERLFIS